MKSSLQTKLFISFMLVVALTLAGFAVGASVLVRQYFFTAKQQELVGKGYEAAGLIDDFIAGRMSATQLVDFVDRIDGFLDARIWAVDASGRLIVMSSPRSGIRVRTDGKASSEAAAGSHMGQTYGPGMGMGPGRGKNQPGDDSGPGMGRKMKNSAALRVLLQDFAPVFQGEILTRTFFHPYYEEEMMMVAVPVVNTANGATTGAVILNAPMQGLNSFLTRIYLAIAVIGVLALILTLLIVRRLSRGIVRPLRDMEATAAAMAEGCYDRRVVTSSRDEVGQLGESLNKLARELAGFVSRTQQMEKVRRDFVANVSHELRTPLTIIRGYTEALRDGTVTDPEQTANFNRLIVTETERLERLINDLLDLSRLQSGNAVMDVEPIPLADVVDNVVGLLQSKAAALGIAIEWRRSEVPPIQGNGDRLVQLLLILLDNAMKYTPSGGKVTVRLESLPGKMSLTVADTGKGIPEEDLPFIWDRFYKVDKAHSRASQGTGLGLAIAKEIVERHGAGITVTSAENCGTQFVVEFVSVNNREESY